MSTAFRLLLLAAVAFVSSSPAGAADASSQRPRDRWNFKLKEFIIGAWWGPGATDAEMKLYKEAGFNTVMGGRYMELEDYGNPSKGEHELDLAQKYGLGVFFDTYTKNDRPWGGKAGPTDAHSSHHPASLVELQWLYQRIGKHPALVGFMIGDDQGAVSERADACTKFLFEQRPQLMPWLCGWISPKNLAEHNNPIVDPQIYPSLYQWGAPAEEQARQYCAAYASFSRQCRDLGLYFWPMFNSTNYTYGKRGKDMFGYCPSDSLLRLPAYAALAYGAEGIWYFTYNGGALQHLGEWQTEKEARAALTPLYPIASKINHRVAAWGPRLLGRTSTGLFGTAFGAAEARWPFPGDPGSASAEALAPPAAGKLVQEMSDHLLVGILTQAGKAPLAMVVDCRTSKSFGDLKPRTVSLSFAPAVSRIGVLESKGGRSVGGSRVQLTLEAGGGQLLELHGTGLDALCAESAIYAAGTAPASDRPLKPNELPGIKAARLRIDCFGANSEPEYQAKYIELNGHRIAKVPGGGGDAWSTRVIELAPEQLRYIWMQNLVTVRTECQDAWKFRNLALAVQRADGSWAKTQTDATVFSPPDWAHSEGTRWGRDGVAGPVNLKFQ